MRPDSPQELDDVEQSPSSWWQRLKDWMLSSARPISLGDAAEGASESASEPPRSRRALPAGEPSIRVDASRSEAAGAELPVPSPASIAPTVEVRGAELLHAATPVATASSAAPSEATLDVLSTPVLVKLADRLAVEEVEPQVALALLREVCHILPRPHWNDEVEVFAEAARVLLQWCPVAGPVKLKKGQLTVVALIGPTGVGKSTMLAKLASIAAHKDKLLVGLITSDTHRIAAVEQIRAYARLLELPLAVARTREEMQEALTAYQNKDVVFVDTAGQSPNEAERLKELEELLGEDARIRRYLVMSATTKHSDIKDIVRRFEPIGYEALIINKLDESRTHGVLINAPYVSGRPLSYLGVGQNVPQDLELASRERVVDLILNLSGRFVREG